MKINKLSGLFINCVEAQDSIFESGKMAFECLLNSDKYSLDYIEISPNKVSIPTNYDFYLFNYHLITMSWLDAKSIKKLLPGVKMTIVLEVSPNDPFVFCSPDDFDAYIVLDPTLNIEAVNAFAFPRPLETLNEKISYQPKEIPVIGSFGFATPGKGFEHVIDAVNREFEKAVVRINIPYSTYADESGKFAKQLAQMCKDRAKSGVEVIITHDFMTKSELIKWCGQNTLNCFLYDRNQPGLAATTDQAITSGRPLITSKNNTFRHIQKFIKPFPYQSLKSAIENTQKDVQKIQSAWSAKNFRARFEEVLTTFDFENSSKREDTVKLSVLPPEPPPPTGFIQTVKENIAIRTRIKNFRNNGTLKRKIKVKSKPTVSISRFGEDKIIDELFNKIPIKSLSYLEISANNPTFISNTELFYLKDFSGVLVITDPILYEQLKLNRPKDTVLNLKIKADSNINEIIEKYFTECPDFISIDVKDWDLQILKTFDFEKYSPAAFCVETLAYKKDGSTYRIQEIQTLLENRGYFSFNETKAANIFVNKNLYDFYLYQENQRQPENYIQTSV